MCGIKTENVYKLPLSYGDNNIAILSVDPQTIFAYWEISDEIKIRLSQSFNCDAWERSYPALKVTNISKNNSFFIRINEFSNSWYINVPDSNSLYTIEIGRKLSDSFFVSFANSNCTYTPAENISPNTNLQFVNYNTFDIADSGIVNHNLNKDANQYLQSTPAAGLSSFDISSILPANTECL